MHHIIIISKYDIIIIHIIIIIQNGAWVRQEGGCVIKKYTHKSCHLAIACVSCVCPMLYVYIPCLICAYISCYNILVVSWFISKLGMNGSLKFRSWMNFYEWEEVIFLFVNEDFSLLCERAFIEEPFVFKTCLSWCIPERVGILIQNPLLNAVLRFVWDLSYCLQRTVNERVNSLRCILIAIIGYRGVSSPELL